FQAVRDHYAALLSGIVADDSVGLAFTDERGALDRDRVFPSATVYLYDVQYDSRRRAGGKPTVAAANEDGTTASVTKTPAPINLYFQFDTYAEKRDQDWLMMEKLAPLFADRQARITVPANEESGATEKHLYMVPQSIDTLNEITDDNLWRKAYRFRLEVWFPHQEAAQEKYLVLQRRLNSQGIIWTMDEPPE
ncbi:MAG: hypothetical protein KAY24_12985, partial [Candidatus Eisenbacteria sp.]|nr:hypothetical protein [Candidatus Eisenbacteria bacterium]